MLAKCPSVTMASAQSNATPEAGFTKAPTRMQSRRKCPADHRVPRTVVARSSARKALYDTESHRRRRPPSLPRSQANGETKRAAARMSQSPQDGHGAHRGGKDDHDKRPTEKHATRRPMSRRPFLLNLSLDSTSQQQSHRRRQRSGNATRTRNDCLGARAECG